MIADKKKKRIFVVDSPSDWDRNKTLLEEQLDCKIDVFPEARLARKALSSNGDYALAIIDPYNWTRGWRPVEARIEFIKELGNNPLVIIFTRVGYSALEQKYKLVRGRDYQSLVQKRDGSKNELLEEMRELIGR